MSTNHVPRARARRLLSSLVLAAVLVGCGGVNGTYEASQKTADGTFTMSLKLESGKKATWTLKGGPAGSGSMSLEGTYSVDGKKVSVVLAGDTQVFTLEGGGLSTDMMGQKTVLKKK